MFWENCKKKIGVCKVNTPASTICHATTLCMLLLKLYCTYYMSYGMCIFHISISVLFVCNTIFPHVHAQCSKNRGAEVQKLFRTAEQKEAWWGNQWQAGDQCMLEVHWSVDCQCISVCQSGDCRWSSGKVFWIGSPLSATALKPTFFTFLIPSFRYLSYSGFNGHPTTALTIWGQLVVTVLPFTSVRI